MGHYLYPTGENLAIVGWVLTIIKVLIYLPLLSQAKGKYPPITCKNGRDNHV